MTDFVITLYNGFNLGLERKVNSPTWACFDGEGYEIHFFTGFTFNLGFLRFNIGSFLDPDEFIEEIEGEP